jgi:hypothetical protein
LANVRRFSATLSAKGYAWFWPRIAAALTSKHHCLVIACNSCDNVVDLDLRVKPRDPEASIRVALRDVQCPRFNGHGKAANPRVGAACVGLRILTPISELHQARCGSIEPQNDAMFLKSRRVF